MKLIKSLFGSFKNKIIDIIKEFDPEIRKRKADYEYCLEHR